MTGPTFDAERALAALQNRHGLDRGTVAAMVSERSRQQNVSLAQALTDLLAGLDAKNVADALVVSRQPQSPEYG